MDDPPLAAEDDVTDLKLRYYEQQIQLAKHDDKYLEVCKNYRQVLDTEAVENEPDLLLLVRSSTSRQLSPLTLPDTPHRHLLHHSRALRQRAVGSICQNQSR